MAEVQPLLCELLACIVAMAHLLGFQLLPRLKGIHRQRLHRPATGPPDAYLVLQAVLTRPINWALIAQQ